MQTQAFPTLPQGFKRFTVEQLLLDVAPHIGLRSGALQALLHMIRATRPADWTDPSSEPVFFGQQQATARALGKTVRALRTTEHRLEALGLVERRVKGNGQRSSYGRCGLVFSRLISLVPDLIALSEQKKQEDAYRRHLAGERSAHLRYAKCQLAALDPNLAAVKHLQTILSGWPRADRLHTMPLCELEEHVAEVKQVCVSLDDLEIDHHKQSGEPAENFRHHIQENNLREHFESCNVSVSKRCADKSAPTHPVRSGAYAPDQCLENKHEQEPEAHKPKSVDWLTPDMLFQMASPEMQAALLGETDGERHLRPTDFFGAAHALLPVLGVNRSAWNEAIEHLGPQTTWLTILCLDANRDHPTTPVRNVGGALRAVTRRALAGKFHLHGTLIGLAERKGVRRTAG